MLKEQTCLRWGVYIAVYVYCGRQSERFFVVVSSRVLLITNTHCHRGVLQLWHSIFMWVFKFTIIHNWNNNIADPWMSFSCRSSRNLVLDNRRKVTALNYFQYWSPSPPFHPILLLNPEIKCCISRGPFFTWSLLRYFYILQGTSRYFKVLWGTSKYFGLLLGHSGTFSNFQVLLFSRYIYFTAVPMANFSTNSDLLAVSTKLCELVRNEDKSARLS